MSGIDHVPLPELSWQDMPLNGNVLIEASAGTGKTYSMMLIIMRLLVERQLPLSQMMVMTFTEAATLELRTRLGERLHQCLAWLSTHREHMALSPAEATTVSTTSDPLHEYFQKRWQLSSQKVEDALLLRRAERQWMQMPIHTLHGMSQFLLNSFSVLPTETNLELVDGQALEAQETEQLMLQYLERVEEIDQQFVREGNLKFIRRTLQLCLKHSRLRLATAVAPSAQDIQQCRRQVVAKSVEINALIHPSYALKKAFSDTLTRVLQKLHAQQDLYLSDLDFQEQSDLQKLKPVPKVSLDSNEGFQALVQLRDVLRKREQIFLQSCINQIYEQVCQRARTDLAKTGRQSFASMVSNLSDALDPPNANVEERSAARRLAMAIRKRFPVALIDEFQDTDAAQFAAFHAIYPESGLFVVGDPKQSIYRFRGSDVHTFNRAKSNARCFALKRNYRSAAGLIDALNDFYSVPNAFALEHIQFEAVAAARSSEHGEETGVETAAARIVLSVCKDNLDLVETACAQVIQRLHTLDFETKSTPGKPKAFSIAMLFREHAEIRKAADYLRARQIPVQVVSNENILQSLPGRLIRACMRAAAEPANAKIARASLQLFLAEVPLVSSTNEIRLADDALALSWAAGIHAQWLRNGIVRVLQRLWGRLDPERLGSVDAAQWQADIAALAQYLGTKESILERQSHGRMEATAGFEWLKSSLLRLVEDAAENADVSEQSLRRLASQSSTASVHLMTVFASKGLEFDEVFLPSLGAKLRVNDVPIVPQPAQATLLCDCFGLEQKDAALREQLESESEALRLQYVALTRAKKHVHILVSDHQLIPNSKKPNAFCRHLQVLARERQLMRAQDPGGSLARPLDSALSVFPAETQALLQAFICNRDCSVRRIDVQAEYASTFGPDLVTRHAWNALPVRSVNRELRRRSSFSSIAASASVSATSAAVIDSDLLELVNAKEAFILDGEIHEATAMAANSNAALVALADLRGAAFGVLVHALIEQVLQQPANARADRQFSVFGAQSIQKNPLAKNINPPITDETAEAISEMIFRTLHAPVSAGLAIMDLPIVAARTELRFELPIRKMVQARVSEIESLCQIQFSDALQTLSIEPGALVGAIDLLFESQGRFYVLDYKTNDLGSSITDYEPASLQAAMVAHDYHLQHMLYQFSLHRYLQSNLTNYDPVRHLGGAIYLFTRAVGLDQANPELGIFRHCLDLKALSFLDALLNC
jgi:exodeoxyribonuclease V beta subunit